MRPCRTRPNRVPSALWLALAGVLLLPGAPVRADAASGARAVVEDTVDRVLLILRDPGLSTDERRSGIEAIALERFDFETMSRLVLARGWRRFDDAQQRQFVEEFRDHLSARYGGRIERYEQEAVDITGERVEPRGDVTISTVLRGGQYDGVQIDYRLRERDGTWRMIDVVIEGVSLVSSFRSQFTEVLSRGGPEEVLRRLREKTEAAAETAEDTPPGVPREARSGA